MKHGVLAQNEGAADAHVFLLEEKTCRVGRTRDCDVALIDRSVSRNHAEIVLESGDYVLSDLGSRNGTRVNGIGVVRRVLREGGQVRFGTVSLVFHEMDDREDPPPDVDEADAPPTDGGLDLPAEVTGSFGPDELRDPVGLRAIDAWQIVRAFNNCEAGQELDALQRVLDDIAGIRDMHRVVLYLAPGMVQAKAKWIRGGHPHRRTYVLPEARIVKVVETGEGYPRGVMNTPWRGDDVAADPACIPVLIGGKSLGALYVEGDGGMPGEVTDAVVAAGEAIGLGLTLRFPPGPLHPTPTGRTSSLEIIGRSQPLHESIRIAGRAGRSDSTVLIVGESGTGKELFARFIYSQSARTSNPFVTVHSSAIEETLLGSALFGHEKGAFTGAVGMKRGLFEEADGGTLFLDEIGELSPSMQVKLLRVLQEGEFMRLGGNKPIRVDVRVVAATNRNLEEAVQDGIFREDLYYRLKVIELRVPPLRDRQDDIPDLVRYFIDELGKKLLTQVRDVSPEAMKMLQQYRWPGNVRELRNLVERSLVLAEGDMLRPEDFPPEIAASCLSDESHSTTDGTAGPSVQTDLSAIELQHILRVLDDCGGNKKLAAHELGISRSTLYERLKRTSDDRARK